MDQNTIITLFVFIFTDIGTIISMFLWIRSEANSDRKKLTSMVAAIREDGWAFKKAMMEESKDFHARLCSIEERNRK